MDIWKKIRLVIIYFIEVYFNLDINKFFFNIGLFIWLLDLIEE